MPAQLVALTEGPSILLDKPILLVGRSPECDIQINSRKVSRMHCCIAQVSNYLVVRDLGSTNGVRINGVRVLEGRLQGGDELTIGNSRYKVEWEGLSRLSVSRANGGKPAAKDAPRPGPAVSAPAARDEQLESCDDPVPLAEPARAHREPPCPTDRPPFSILQNDRQVVEHDSEPVAEPGRPYSHILPDDIKLAPSSDVYPDVNNNPPPSQPTP
jgi:predicted component of type VI protein secretion system